MIEGDGARWGERDVVLEGGRGKNKKKKEADERNEKRKRRRGVFVFSRQKFSEIKKMVKVGKKLSARVEHICKTPPGWNKETVWEVESRSCYT